MECACSNYDSLKEHGSKYGFTSRNQLGVFSLDHLLRNYI